MKNSLKPTTDCRVLSPLNAVNFSIVTLNRKAKAHPPQKYPVYASGYQWSIAAAMPRRRTETDTERHRETNTRRHTDIETPLENRTTPCAEKKNSHCVTFGDNSVKSQSIYNIVVLLQKELVDSTFHHHSLLGVSDCVIVLLCFSAMRFTFFRTESTD